MTDIDHVRAQLAQEVTTDLGQAIGIIEHLLDTTVMTSDTAPGVRRMAYELIAKYPQVTGR